MEEQLGVRVIKPVKGFEIGAKFGDVGSWWKTFHKGDDFLCQTGTQVYAVVDGTARYAWDNDLGCFIWVDDGCNWYKYCHLSRVEIENGSVVKKGQVIGLSGSTGHVEGPHLHFEIRSSSNTPLKPIYIEEV